MSQELVDIEDFVPDIITELPGIPYPAIERRILDAVIEACERAPIWQHSFSEIPVAEGQVCFDLPKTPGDTRMHDVLYLLNNLCPFENIPLNDTRANPYLTIPNRGHGYHVPKRGQVALNVAPIKASSPFKPQFPPEVGPEPINPGTLADGATQVQIDDYLMDLELYNEELAALREFETPRACFGLDVTVSVKPSRNASKIARCFWDDYYQLVIDGTLAYAYDMRDAEWYDSAEVIKRRQAFEYEIAKAKQAMDRGFSDRPIRIRPRRF